MGEVTRAEVEAIRRCDWRGLAQVEVLLQYIKQLEAAHTDLLEACLKEHWPWSVGDSALFGGQVVTLTRIDTDTEPHGAWVKWDEGGVRHDMFANFPTPGDLEPVAETATTLANLCESPNGAVSEPESPSGPAASAERHDLRETATTALQLAIVADKRVKVIEERLDEIAEWIAGQQRGRYYAGKTRPVGVDRLKNSGPAQDEP